MTTTRKPKEERRLSELEFETWRSFLYAYSEVVGRLDRDLASEHGIGLNQFEVLAWLARAGTSGLRMSDLASRVVLTPSGVTRAVDQLERKGLVSRCVFSTDKRGQLASLTPEGRAFLRKASRTHVAGLHEHFLQHLDQGKLAALSAALRAVLEGEGSPLPSLVAP